MTLKALRAGTDVPEPASFCAMGYGQAVIMVFVEVGDQGLEEVAVVVCEAEMQLEHSLVLEGLVDGAQVLGLKGIL